MLSWNKVILRSLKLSVAQKYKRTIFYELIKSNQKINKQTHTEFFKRDQGLNRMHPGEGFDCRISLQDSVQAEQKCLDGAQSEQMQQTSAEI